MQAPEEEKNHAKSIPEHIEEIKKWKTGSGGGQGLHSKTQVIRTVIFTAFPALIVLFIIYLIMTSGRSSTDEYCKCDPF